MGWYFGSETIPFSHNLLSNGFSIHWWPTPESIMPWIDYKRSDFLILSLLHLSLRCFTVKRPFPFPLHHPSSLFNNFLGHKVTSELRSCKPKGCDQHKCWNISQGKGGTGQEEMSGVGEWSKGHCFSQTDSGKNPEVCFFCPGIHYMTALVTERQTESNLTQLEKSSCYGLNVCVPHKIHMLEPKPQCDGIWRWAFEG